MSPPEEIPEPDREPSRAETNAEGDRPAAGGSGSDGAGSAEAAEEEEVLQVPFRWMVWLLIAVAAVSVWYFSWWVLIPTAGMALWYAIPSVLFSDYGEGDP